MAAQTALVYNLTVLQGRAGGPHRSQGADVELGPVCSLQSLRKDRLSAQMGQCTNMSLLTQKAEAFSPTLPRGLIG